MQNNRESGFYNPRVFLAFVLCFGGALLALISVAAPTPPPSKPAAQAAPATGLAPTVSRSVFNTVSAPVSSMPRIQLYMPRAFEEEEGLRKIRPDRPVPPNFVDAALQRALGRFTPLAPEALPAPLVTFDGINASEACGSLCLPPDPNGAIGPTQYVEMVNTAFSVYDKAGVRLSGPTAINALWQNLPGTCKDNNNGDPVVVYDQLADRWMLTQFAFPFDNNTPSAPTAPWHECIAISQTSDATGAYYIYDFELSKTKFEDYPHLGLWPDAYYMSTHQFNAAGTAYVGAAVWAFERDKMLAGRPAQMVSFDLGPINLAFGGHLPANVDGFNPPPPGAPNYFVQVDTAADIPPVAAMRLWKFHVDWANPAVSTYGINGQPNSVIPVADFARPNCSQYATGCVPQAGDAFQLDPIGDRLMFRLAYRNFGDHEALVVNHTVVADATTGQMGPRWYEVRDPNGTPAIYQQGTYGPSGPTDVYRWMGSAAMDRSGDIAIGYSTSSNLAFPSIAYAGRVPATAWAPLPRAKRKCSRGLRPNMEKCSRRRLDAGAITQL